MHTHANMIKCLWVKYHHIAVCADFDFGCRVRSTAAFFDFINSKVVFSFAQIRRCL